MATENPAFAGGAGAPSSEPAVDVEAALKDGTLTAEQAVVVQERQLRDEMARLEARLRAELGGGGGATLASAVRGVVARLTETPTNFHQATVFFLAADAPEDAAMARRAPLLYAGSLAMVLLQSMAAVGVQIGTFLPSCSTTAQCDIPGMYCRLGVRARCDFCGED